MSSQMCDREFHTHAHMHVDNTAQYWESSSAYFIRQGLSLNLVFTGLPRLILPASPRDLRTFTFPVLELQVYTVMVNIVFKG